MNYPLAISDAKIINYQKIIPDAFHGTDLDSARGIEAEQKFSPTLNEKEYLGDGVYFFENSKWHAIDWARRKCQKNGFESLAVLNATINLGKCLDLSNYDHRRIVKQVVTSYKKWGVNDVPDGVAINIIHKKCNIDSARGVHVTPEIGKIFEGSDFFDYSYLMICVKNKDNISNINLIYSEILSHD